MLALWVRGISNKNRKYVLIFHKAEVIFWSLFLDILYPTFPIKQPKLVDLLKNKVDVFLQTMCKHTF